MTKNDDVEKRFTSKRFDELISPSWLSGLIAVIAGLIVTVGVLLTFSFNNSLAKQQLIGLENTSSPQPALTLPGENPPGTTNNSLQNTWPLLAFWGMVGLIVYFVVELIVKGITNAEEFSNELTYVHAKRTNLIRSALEYLLLRFVFALVWLVFIDFLKRIIPYSIVAADASASNFRSTSGLLDAFLGFSMIVISMHVHTIFLRLTLRRVRVLSGYDYLDI